MWVQFHRLTYIRIFPVKMNCFRHVPDYRAIVLPKQRLIGNIIAQTPTLDSLSCCLFQATLIRLVWEKPINRIPKISKILRSKEG